MIILPILALAALQSRVAEITLDGGVVNPIEQRLDYEIRCPDGIVTLNLSQKGHAAPTLLHISYAGKSLDHISLGPANGFLRQLRTLNTVFPRCLTSGGVLVHMSGLKRGSDPSQKISAVIRVDSRGRLTMN